MCLSSLEKQIFSGNCIYLFQVINYFQMMQFVTLNLKFSPAATRGYPAAASNSCRSFSQSGACSGKHQRVSVQYYAGWGVQGEKESDEFPC